MWKKILGGFILFIVAVVAIAMFATSGLTQSAEKFFAYVSAKNYDKAYAMLSEDFKSTTSKEQLKQFLEQNGFTKYKSAKWGNRMIDGNRGKLEGSIITVDNTAIPVTLKMIEDGDGNWKIYAISKPQSGILNESSNTNMGTNQNTTPSPNPNQSANPTQNQNINSASNGSLNPNSAVNSNQNQNTNTNANINPNQSVNPTQNQNINSAPNGNLNPNPAVNSNQNQNTNTNLNTPSNLAQSTNLNSNPTPNNNSNSNIDRKYVEMVKNTIHTFALSAKEKSMERIYKDMATVFKRQISLEKMNQLFKDFITHDVDLTVVDPMEPIFDKKPTIDADGILELKGHYPTTPSVLRFDLKYYKENGVWKLVGIHIKVK